MLRRLTRIGKHCKRVIWKELHRHVYMQVLLHSYFCSISGHWTVLYVPTAGQLLKAHRSACLLKHLRWHAQRMQNQYTPATPNFSASQALLTPLPLMMKLLATTPLLPSTSSSNVLHTWQCYLAPCEMLKEWTSSHHYTWYVLLYSYIYANRHNQIVVLKHADLQNYFLWTLYACPTCKLLYIYKVYVGYTCSWDAWHLFHILFPILIASGIWN